MGDFSSWVTLSMKFDCRRLRLMALIVEDQVDDDAGQQHGDERAAQRQQHPVQGASRSSFNASKTLSNTQPTVNTTSSTIMTIASVMGRLRERRTWSWFWSRTFEQSGARRSVNLAVRQKPA